MNERVGAVARLMAALLYLPSAYIFGKLLFKAMSMGFKGGEGFGLGVALPAFFLSLIQPLFFIFAGFVLGVISNMFDADRGDNGLNYNFVMQNAINAFIVSLILAAIVLLIWFLPLIFRFVMYDDYANKFWSGLSIFLFFAQPIHAFLGMTLALFGYVFKFRKTR